jgi:crotonobetainyl-CoA:carnitine CoA-transferase CaiB-like acyl-CoA transferase
VSNGLLAGIRVLDLGVWRPGPYATQLLADLGADVLKVEPPGGDPLRIYPELFAQHNAGKRSIVLDLKTDADRERALELAAGADVVVEGFRPGVAARLGLGADDVRAVNPSAIYCSLSGFGQDGPLHAVPGHDVNYQAWGGALAPEGGAPRVSALPIADLAGGMAAAFAVCAALVHRLREGAGELIDVAMADVMATWTGAASSTSTVAAGREERGVPGYGTFVTADGGYIALGVLTEDHFWRGLCDGLGLDDIRDLEFAARMARTSELTARVAAVIASEPRDDLVARLLAGDVPVSPVLDRHEMTALEHFAQRSVVTSVPWATRFTGHPVRFASEPATARRPPPALDEHRGTGW